MELWNNNTEITFFTEALKNFASVEQLFYNLHSGYFAYIPKGFETERQTLQSRNSLIGQFTETWCKNLFNPVAQKLGLYAVNGVVCNELGLTRQTSADLAFCTTDNKDQKAENIKLLFEIKMSIVSNYQYIDGQIKYIGDYKQHKGNPSLLRSDSMLKATGKAINIRVSGMESTKIPIIVLGNTPVTKNYTKKVDFLKQSGVVQGFWSLNPNPINDKFINQSPQEAFQTIYNEKQLFDNCKMLVESEFNYFSSMIAKQKLGAIIKISAQEQSDVAKAEKFLSLIRS
ncbi:MAG: hypothetical protein LBR28_02450 [Bacteroidales bacterium]|jgi:hypothetical protein|nr:hypothetical protein [Bacteroidales bacterium]